MARGVQLSRQWRLFRLLEHRAWRAIEDLAAELGVTTRTVRRDLDALSYAGWPITSDKVDGRVRWPFVEGCSKAFSAEHAESAEVHRGLVSEQAGMEALIPEGFRPSGFHWNALLLSAFPALSAVIGSAAEVLEPTSLCREIAGEARKIAERGEEICHGAGAAHGGVTSRPQSLPRQRCNRRDRRSARTPLGEAG